MSEVVGEAWVKLRSDDRTYAREIGAQINRSVRSAALKTAGALGIGFGVREVIGQITQTVNKAREASDVLSQTRNALRAAGLSWETYGKQIQDTANKQAAAFGLDDEDLLRSFTLLLRATKDVTKAQQLNALAADVARGRNMDLVSAAQLLVRVQAGQVGSLRRLGIQIDKNATGQEALLQVQKQYAGAAQTFAEGELGAQQRLAKVYEDTQEIIGGALAPTITDLTNRVREQLQAWNDSGETQRRVNEVLGVAKDAISGVHDAWSAVHMVLGPVVDAVGGTRRAVELLVIAMSVRKIAGFASAIGGIAGQAQTAIGGIRNLITWIGNLNRQRVTTTIPTTTAGLPIPGAGGSTVGKVAKAGALAFRVAGSLIIANEIAKSVMPTEISTGGLEPYLQTTSGHVYTATAVSQLLAMGKNVRGVWVTRDGRVPLGPKGQAQWTKAVKDSIEARRSDPVVIAATMAGGPGAGGPAIDAAAVVKAARSRGLTAKQVSGVIAGFGEKIGDAQTAGDESTQLRLLGEEESFLRRQITRFAKNNTVRRQLKQELGSVVSQAKGITDARRAAADAAAADRRAAREAADADRKAAQERAREAKRAADADAVERRLTKFELDAQAAEQAKRYGRQAKIVDEEIAYIRRLMTKTKSGSAERLRLRGLLITAEGEKQRIQQTVKAAREKTAKAAAKIELPGGIKITTDFLAMTGLGGEGGPGAIGGRARATSTSISTGGRLVNDGTSTTALESLLREIAVGQAQRDALQLAATNTTNSLLSRIAGGGPVGSGTKGQTRGRNTASLVGLPAYADVVAVTGGTP